MALSWGARRQFLYYAVATAFFIVLLAIAASAFSTEPTCLDRRQNGGETGVDCGGGCALVCKGRARAPALLWARAFQTGAQTFTATAYIQNPNPDAAAKDVPYSFQLLDNAGLLIVEKEGAVTLPPGQIIPVIEPHLSVGQRVVSRTLFSFLAEPTWQKLEAKDMPVLYVVNERLEQDGSRLSADLANDTLKDVSDITVIAVLFDPAGTALAASRSFVSLVPRKSLEPLVFTWPGGVEGVTRAEITIIPSL